MEFLVSCSTRRDENLADAFERLNVYATRVFLLDSSARLIVAYPPIDSPVAFDQFASVQTALSGRTFAVSRFLRVLDNLPPSTLAATPTEGIGIVEAPRGTLTHYYWTDERGILTKVNLIVGTTNNYAPISMSIKKAVESFIKRGVVVSKGILNRVEVAFRAYDPSFGCATHSLPGQMPLQVAVCNVNGNGIDVLKQSCNE